MTAQLLLDRAAGLLQDEQRTRWPDARKLEYLNEGLKALVAIAPDAYTLTVVHPLVPGAYQTIPSDGVRLIDVQQNMGLGGATPGRVVREVGRTALDAIDPDWPNARANVTTKHYCFDPRTPKIFTVYPPQPLAPASVRLSYSAVPPQVSLASSIPVDAIYEPALLDYVLYRCYSQDAEHVGPTGRATLHFQAFVSSVGGKEQVDGTTEPGKGAGKWPQSRN